MTNLPTLEDKIKQRIEILKNEKDILKALTGKLNVDDEEERNIITKETQKIFKIEVIIEEYQKLLNDEI